MPGYLQGATGIGPADTSLSAAVRETIMRLFSPEPTPESGMETPVFTEPLSNWAGNQGLPGAIAAGLIPKKRADLVPLAASLAMPVAEASRGPELLAAGATPAEDLVKVFRWGGESELQPGQWVEAASTSKPLSYLLSTKWAPSILGSRFAPYSSGVSHAVERGTLQDPTGLGAALAYLMGQRRFIP